VRPSGAVGSPRRLRLLAVLCLLSPLPAATQEPPVGRYAGFLDDLLARWPAAGASAGDQEPGLALTCLETPGEARYVGARQELVIRAPLAAVAAALDDIPHYRDLYPDCVEVRVLEGDREGTHYVTGWERRVPLFFIPNTRFTLVHEIDRSTADRVVYRYRLQGSGRLKQLDGVAVLEAIGTDVTRLVEYDFFDAHWGPLPASRVWRESLRGIFQADMSMKLRSENPAWSYPKIRAEVERLWELNTGLVERCLGASQVAALP
jgi:hypothetical protein